MSLRTASAQDSGLRVRDADAYLFDIDGTLLSTRDLVHWNALHAAMLEAFGADTTIEGIQYHGKTDLGILRAAAERVGVTKARFEKDLEVALTVVRREVTKNAAQIEAVVCPSIREVLQQFGDKGKLLGVASGNLADVGWMKLQACGLAHFFQYGCFSDHCEARCEIFRMAVREARLRVGDGAKVCFVGDTPADIAAAREVEAGIVAVATGVFSLEELNSHQPDACFGCCSELLS